MDICYKNAGGKFNFRAAALIIKNGKLLIHRLKTDSFYALPGGRVTLMEDTEAAILRELKEELNVKAKVKSLLWISENFFELYSEKFHEIGFYYLVECDDKNLNIDIDCFDVNEDGKILEFKWVKLEELKDIEFYPIFIKDRIFDLPTTIEKVVDINDKMNLDLYRR